MSGNKTIDWILLARVWAERLRSVDYDGLNISAYNKQYLCRLLPALPYYMRIYARCLSQCLRSAVSPPSGITLVDYGGGCGFLSILAKAAGFGRVIYIDLNPLSVATVHVLRSETGRGPDVILQGDSADLVRYCTAQEITPHMLIATDVIEHVYDLPVFFAGLCTLSPVMQMMFTTASTPYNPLIKRRLHRFMVGCETGRTVEPNYFNRRRQFLLDHYPHLTGEALEQWTVHTRGQTYDDMRKALDAGQLPQPADRYNTCDPETGNWAERILPVRAYRAFVSPYGYRLTVAKGFYNVRRSNPLTSFVARIINTLIRCSGSPGLSVSPFLFLHFRRDGKK
ncbi:MAG: SAM-dependent methyltransferase [Tannerella sp.]|jgi:hypothetical protein|nr:SAM-dependent methyltransferase [Tannerella sp.]